MVEQLGHPLAHLQVEVQDFLFSPPQENTVSDILGKRVVFEEFAVLRQGRGVLA